MSIIKILIFSAIIFSALFNSALASEKKSSRTTPPLQRKVASIQNVEDGIKSFKFLLKCAENIKSREEFLNCSEKYALKINNERHFSKIVGSVATGYPKNRNYRECTNEDLEAFPLYGEKNFDFLICFDFTLAGLDKTVVLYLININNKLFVKDLEY